MRPFQLLQQSSVAPENYNHFVRPLWFFCTRQTQIRPIQALLKKIICFIAATVQCSRCCLGNDSDGKKDGKQKDFILHALDSQRLVRKGCYCFVEASASMDPSSTDGRQFKVSARSPRRASEVRTGLSAGWPPRVIVPPAMQNSRPSGRRWGRLAAAVAPLSLGWLVSDREQTHNES